MTSAVIYCPHLNRDIRDLLERVPGLYIYEGQPTARGEDGCLQSHVALVAWAHACGFERLWVMEDDCELTEHFDLERWEADADWAQAHEYDVMSGGCTRTYDEKLVRSECWKACKAGHGSMIEVSAFHSAHCVVYFASGYERALKAVQPYDVSLGRDCGLRCVLTWPFVAVQRASFSGILRQPVDYVPLYQQHERELGRALGCVK